MASGRRIGLFGGTFDPVHLAHLTVAREALQALQLDRVLFVPAAHPPHKFGSSMAPYEHRYRMVELACARDSHLVPSRLEEGKQRSYSIRTVERLRRELAAGDRILFLIGADAFAEIRTWFRWEDLLRMVEFIVVTRPGHDYEAPPGARVHRLETVALPVSSSDIRTRLGAGEQPVELPAAVYAYIREHSLYRRAG